MAPSRATEMTASSATSSLVGDPSLKPFLTLTFDPIDHLNATLPSLTFSSTQAHASRQANSLPLSEVSSQTQTVLSQLSAQTSRLSGILTQLTDEILRSGGRLAYEVDVLRSETTGLTETLRDQLQDDISQFIPNESITSLENSKKGEDSGTFDQRHTLPLTVEKASKGQSDRPEEITDTVEPPYIAQLRTLTLVRNRLDGVINTFGEAMEWTLSPSDFSATSSFISVSAPEPASDSHAREQKGKDVARKLRDEISNALVHNSDAESGVQAATERVEQLRDLATVWKGTAEEKARIKFVESLAKMVEDQTRSLDRGVPERGHRYTVERTASPRKLAVSPSNPGRHSGEDDRNNRSVAEGGPSFLRNLQRLRDEIYLD